MRCITCGYRLRGLDGTTCPECAREFDPDDPKSYMPDSGPPFPIRFVWVVVLFTVAATSIALTLVQVALETSWSDLVRSVVALFFLVFVATGLPTFILITLSWLIKRRKFKDT